MDCEGLGFYLKAQRLSILPCQMCGFKIITDIDLPLARYNPVSEVLLYSTRRGGSIEHRKVMTCPRSQSY